MGISVETPVLNVKNLGAIGNGIADDTLALKKAAESMTKAKNGRLHLPRGEYRITAPIYFPNLCGMLVSGDGARHGVGKGWDQYACGTTIIADFAGGPAFDLYSCAGFRISDMAFVGRGSGLRGMSLRTRKGFGSGCGMLDNVRFFGFKEGFNAGIDGEPANAADVNFYNVSFESCERGFVAHHLQALNYGFFGCSALKCGTVFDLTGGSILVQMLGAAECGKIIYVRGSGTNIGYATVMNMRLDGKMRSVIYEVAPEAAQGARGVASFLNCHAIREQVGNSARFIVRDRHRLDLRGGSNLFEGGPWAAALGKDAACSINIEHYHLPTVPTFDVTGKGVIRTQQCFDWDGAFLPVKDYTANGNIPT